MKKIIALVLLVSLIFTLVACSSIGGESRLLGTDSQLEIGTGAKAGASVATYQAPETTSNPVFVEDDNEGIDPSLNDSNKSYIILDGDSITFYGSGAMIDGNILTITSAGIYEISGILSDGQIEVNAGAEEVVELILNETDITYSQGAPIYVNNAGKTVITLAEGTANYITDGATYVFEDAESDEPNAVIFSQDDLIISGNGSLVVSANYKNGITCKDDLEINGGSVTVNAVNDGIKGKDSIVVKDGTIIVNAGGDGLQSNNDEDVEKGYISIEGGILNIVAGLDGIQAETSITVNRGDITVSSGGGSINGSSKDDWGNWGMMNNSNEASSAESAKGLKAGVDIKISAGTLNIDSSDDSIHSNDSITIDGGEILLASGDDGVHSNSTLVIYGGNLSITKSYEGIESAVLTFNNGNIHVVASDDGINAAGGKDGSSINGRPGQNEFDLSGNYNLTVNGGYIVVDANGDGLDVNGTIDMNGGVVIVNGPTNNGNGPLDYLGAFNITGGFLVAAGSSGMAQAPSASSTQYSVMNNFPSPQAAGTMIHIETENGEEILTFVPTKEYQSVVLSSPALENGLTYVIYSGGSSTGTVTDGLYSGGTYTPGSQVTSFTISSIVTGADSSWGGFPGGPGGGRPGGPGGSPGGPPPSQP
jgi:hypothetical protein